MNLTNPQTFRACLARRREFLSASDAMAYDAGVKMHEQGKECPKVHSPAQNGWMDAEMEYMDSTSERMIGHADDMKTAGLISLLLVCAVLLTIAAVALIAGMQL